MKSVSACKLNTTNCCEGCFYAEACEYYNETGTSTPLVNKNGVVIGFVGQKKRGCNGLFFICENLFGKILSYLY